MAVKVPFSIKVALLTLAVWSMNSFTTQPLELISLNLFRVLSHVGTTSRDKSHEPQTLYDLYTVRSLGRVKSLLPLFNLGHA